MMRTMTYSLAVAIETTPAVTKYMYILHFEPCPANDSNSNCK